MGKKFHKRVKKTFERAFVTALLEGVAAEICEREPGLFEIDDMEHPVEITISTAQARALIMFMANQQVRKE